MGDDFFKGALSMSIVGKVADPSLYGGGSSTNSGARKMSLGGGAVNGGRSSQTQRSSTVSNSSSSSPSSRGMSNFGITSSAGSIYSGGGGGGSSPSPTRKRSQTTGSNTTLSALEKAQLHLKGGGGGVIPGPMSNNHNFGGGIMSRSADDVLQPKQRTSVVSKPSKLKSQFMADEDNTSDGGGIDDDGDSDEEELKAYLNKLSKKKQATSNTRSGDDDGSDNEFSSTKKSSKSASPAKSAASSYLKKRDATSTSVDQESSSSAAYILFPKNPESILSGGGNVEKNNAIIKNQQKTSSYKESSESDTSSSLSSSDDSVGENFEEFMTKAMSKQSTAPPQPSISLSNSGNSTKSIASTASDQLAVDFNGRPSLTPVNELSEVSSSTSAPPPPLSSSRIQPPSSSLAAQNITKSANATSTTTSSAPSSSSASSAFPTSERRVSNNLADLIMASEAKRVITSKNNTQTSSFDGNTFLAINHPSSGAPVSYDVLLQSDGNGSSFSNNDGSGFQHDGGSGGGIASSNITISGIAGIPASNQSAPVTGISNSAPSLSPNILRVPVPISNSSTPSKATDVVAENKGDNNLPNNNNASPTQQQQYSPFPSPFYPGLGVGYQQHPYPPPPAHAPFAAWGPSTSPITAGGYFPGYPPLSPYAAWMSGVPVSPIQYSPQFPSSPLLQQQQHSPHTTAATSLFPPEVHVCRSCLRDMDEEDKEVRDWQRRRGEKLKSKKERKKDSKKKKKKKQKKGEKDETAREQDKPTKKRSLQSKINATAVAAESVDEEDYLKRDNHLDDSISSFIEEATIMKNDGSGLGSGGARERNDDEFVTLDTSEIRRQVEKDYRGSLGEDTMSSVSSIVPRSKSHHHGKSNTAATNALPLGMTMPSDYLVSGILERAKCDTSHRFLTHSSPYLLPFIQKTSNDAHVQPYTHANQ